MSRTEYAVRWHSEHGHHDTPAESRTQAETWARNHATLPGCWAELLVRTIPDWRVSKTYPNTEGPA
jgi:hypothetical protein